MKLKRLVVAMATIAAIAVCHLKMRAACLFSSPQLQIVAYQLRQGSPRICEEDIAQLLLHRYILDSVRILAIMKFRSAVVAVCFLNTLASPQR
mmetsp:Transcript_12268/g.17673  ORF Transcript_12268/g.17673 Transcript_12268/m.17673 type:complete len:93 (+) Transcript_12268:137-415(+)